MDIRREKRQLLWGIYILMMMVLLAVVLQFLLGLG